jgi:putative RNA 2'-phosphotransferase
MVISSAVRRMDNKKLVNISKYLSKHLRHQPERIGLQLMPGGWIAIDVLLEACARDRFPITREELDEVVERNSKQRFAIDLTGEMIRASQGHSIPIDLQLETSTPPDILYHGTGCKNEKIIIETGLNKMARHHVHLSSNIDTAIAVGGRHGKPIVFSIDTIAMQEAGFKFYLSANGVWLVDSVPPQYLRKLEKS